MIGVAKPARVVDPKFRDWIRRQPCLVCTDVQRGGTECAHVRSRGAGGGDLRNCVPLCPRHHHELHFWGARTFQARYRITLKRMASTYWRRYCDAPTPAF
jgi:hypothetical protein